MKRAGGYTLLSMLLALMLLTVALILTASVMKTVVSRWNDDSTQEKSMQLFFTQTAFEVHTAQSMRSSDDHQQLIIQNNGTSVIYQLNGKRLIRRVNGSGYEIVLQHVSTVSFQTFDNTVTIEVTDDQSKNYIWIGKSYLQQSVAQS
ncbi:MAG: competence type IV pilus minor pilin ComGF [Sporolactobacillus sp.]